jgi:hypothetical protein
MRKFLFSSGIIWIAFFIVTFTTQGLGGASMSEVVVITFVPAIAAFLIGLIYGD